MKYSQKLVDQIITLIEADSYTITEICDCLRISRKTFYEWKDNKPEFRKAIEEAEERCEAAMAVLARRSLKRKLQGYTTEEERYEYEPYGSDPSQFKLKKKTVKVKEVAPDMAAIKLVLLRNDQRNAEKEEEKKHEPLPTVIVAENRTPEELEHLKRNIIKLKDKLNEKCVIMK